MSILTVRHRPEPIAVSQRACIESTSVISRPVLRIELDAHRASYILENAMLSFSLPINSK